ncbi:MAG: aspartate-semialdehyde dehydrogenase [Gammaproteobacteria bacterium]|nr:aspartate-semialdehyde dehydrogenase [Gammaproteobacteria bacterium]
MRKFNVAIVGATGIVGETLCEVLQARKFPLDEVTLLASSRSVGKRILVNGKYRKVELLEECDFSNIHIAFFTAGSEVSQLYVPRAVAAGAIVVDNTSHYRLKENVPLVVPEANGELVEKGLQTRIIANPNCSTIQLAVAIKPIYDAVGIDRINIATYQSVSGAGTRAMSELASQTANILNSTEFSTEVFPVQMAFNAIPHIGEFQENGYTAEEMKLVQETKKIFADFELKVNATCVRLPIFIGHSEVIHLETRTKVELSEVKKCFESAIGVQLMNEHRSGGYPTPVVNAAGNDLVFVGRLRQDLSHPNGLSFWVVSDNVRKGAALNSVQIAEELITHLN